MNILADTTQHKPTRCETVAACETSRHLRDLRNIIHGELLVDFETQEFGRKPLLALPDCIRETHIQTHARADARVHHVPQAKSACRHIVCCVSAVAS